MSEKKMWQDLSHLMKGRWHATRHEDGLSEGILDLSFGCVGVQGWVELKYLDRWPTRPGTLVVPNHPLTPHQRLFLHLRGRGCFVMFQVGDIWMLFNWINGQGVGTWNTQQTKDHALKIWPGPPPAADLADYLCGESL